MTHHYDATQQPIKGGHMAIRRDGSLSVVLDDGTGWVVLARYQPQGEWGPSRMTSALHRALYEAASFGYSIDDGAVRLDHVAMPWAFAPPKLRGLAALGIGMCSNPFPAKLTDDEREWVIGVDANKPTVTPGTYVLAFDGMKVTHEAGEGVSPHELLDALDRQVSRIQDESKVVHGPLRLRDFGVRRVT